MKAKKILSSLIALAMTASAFATTTWAAAPSAYDGQAYESLGYTSEDPDGQINLAVIANSDVKIVGDSMYIEGSVYSNGNIYVGDGQGNQIKGLFISGTEGSVDTDEANGLSHTCKGYIHVNDNGTRENITYYSTKPEYAGAIKDDNTTFECAYDEFTVPSIANDLGDVEMNVYGNESNGNLPQTISADTHIGALKMEGSQNNWQGFEAALTIDTTNNDVTVVIDQLVIQANPSIKVVGDHDAYIYINDATYINNLSVNYNTKVWPPEMSGSSDKTHLYINGGDVTLDSVRVAVSDMHVTADKLQISGATTFYGDIESSAKEFTITGGQTEVYGIVCVPNADSKVVDSGTLYGQLHTNTLTNNGAGRIIWKADSAVANNDPTPENPGETDKPSADYYLDIVEDVIYITPGGTATINVNRNVTYDWENITKNGSADYKWELGGNLKDENGMADDVYNFTANYESKTWTATPSQSKAGDEYILTVKSTDGTNLTDTVKIIVVDKLPEPTAPPTEEPTAPPTEEPAPVDPVDPEEPEIVPAGYNYAYIFGYEPTLNEDGSVKLEMGAKDAVTREQVAAMIHRIVKQAAPDQLEYDTSITTDADWALTGMQYLKACGAWKGWSYVEAYAPVKRDEVAMMVARGLHIPEKYATAGGGFSDIEDNPYKDDIMKMKNRGYMDGEGNGEFNPDAIMTRAEFCEMFNDVTQRQGYELVTADGETVTPDGTYHFTEFPTEKWEYNACLRATSAFTNGKVDLQLRADNIRNKSDDWESQMQY